MQLKVFIFASAILVGLLYVLPQLVVAKHLSNEGRYFALNFEVYRDELFYLTRAREVYDGHFPPLDPYFDEQNPNIQNPLPSGILAVLFTVFGGDPVRTFLTAEFIFSGIIFLLLYILGKQLFQSPLWAISFAYITILTPMALRILNFHGA